MAIANKASLLGPARIGMVARRIVPALMIGTIFVFAAGNAPARADDAVQMSITMKDHQFDPAELHAPPGKMIAIHVKNLNPIVSEFESSDLHFEKIVPMGGEGVVYVRPQQPGRYNFYDDFHHETQGFLVVQ
ncbi:MAG: cupredoxin domain-containing protein [Xanthobacteraceae bacterium]